MSDEQPKPAQLSRYQRVRQILDQAAGAAHPSYQGNDRFWNLPYDEFLNTKLYGIPMIAPPGSAAPAALPATSITPAKSCCHGESVSAAPAPPAAETPGRG